MTNLLRAAVASHMYGVAVICLYFSKQRWMHMVSSQLVPGPCTGPLAGVGLLVRRRRPAVGAAPDGSPAPAAPGGPG